MCLCVHLCYVCVYMPHEYRWRLQEGARFCEQEPQGSVRNHSWVLGKRSKHSSQSCLFSPSEGALDHPETNRKSQAERHSPGALAKGMLGQGTCKLRVAWLYGKTVLKNIERELSVVAHSCSSGCGKAEVGGTPVPRRWPGGHGRPCLFRKTKTKPTSHIEKK